MVEAKAMAVYSRRRRRPHQTSRQKSLFKEFRKRKKKNSISCEIGNKRKEKKKT